MRPEHFTILGLAPGPHDVAAIDAAFAARRLTLLRRLDDHDAYAQVRRDLELLYLAYGAAREAAAERSALGALAAAAPLDPAVLERVVGPARTNRGGGEDEAVARVRQLIAASFEDGLLRHSRRQAILELARQRGLSEFQTQLLIAQEQIGDRRVRFASRPTPQRELGRGSAWMRLVATALLAAAMFLGSMHWLGA